jgi:hypothetical protein
MKGGRAVLDLGAKGGEVEVEVEVETAHVHNVLLSDEANSSLDL